MVTTTRIKTGTILKLKYDYPSLKLVGESKTPSPRSARPGRHSVKRKGSQGPRYQVELEKQVNPPLGDEILGFDPEILDRFIPEPPCEDLSEGINFVPPVSFGGHQTEGLSAIGHADQKIAQWEQIRAAHEKHLPRVLPLIDERIREAREAREKLLDNEANLIVANQEVRDRKVADRIAVLEEALSKSRFPPEAANIQAAIDGYNSGNIVYSAKYTLIWAGKIIEQADTYAEFTADRNKRLDQYAQKYGAGWLWWESPLKVHPNHAPRMSRATDLMREVCYNGLGHYWVDQCYWKRAGWVMRLPGRPGDVLPPIPDQLKPNFLQTLDGRVWTQIEGPRLTFNSLLDSGATYPSLHEADFKDLGVELDLYCAQTVETCQTANGFLSSRVYEMYVTVVKSVSGGYCSLVDENDAVWPYHGKYLGGLCPVTMIAGPPPGVDPEGFIPNNRLSGILPFLACYVTSTPTRNRLILGENRNDVMGLHRTPGHRRWDIALPSTQWAHAEGWERFGDPKITFRHRRGTVIDNDRDDINHASSITAYPGQPNEMVVHFHPKSDCDADRARRQQAQFEAAPLPIGSF